MIDCETLLQPIGPDAPCGENLEYDSAFGEMERAAVGKPEQQFGETIVPAEEPNWREIQSHGVDLVARTKDLRVVVHLARAVLMLEGLPAFSKDLELIRGYVEQFWETVHPQLDPDDGNDPILRVNTLESLADTSATLRLLRQVPLVSSRAIGRFSLRDIAIADGEVPAPADGSEPPDWNRINAAFTETPLEELSANAGAVQAAIEHLAAIEKAFSDRVGSGSGVNLKPLAKDLEAAAKVYTAQLAKRGVSAQGAEAGAAEGGNGAVEAGAPQRLSGQINSRDDVIAALENVCEYYSQYEPSSPLPLLVQRCKRLVTASFLEIIQDILPDALPQAEAIRGRVE
jgi:type VI secretion system protein ImpA